MKIHLTIATIALLATGASWAQSSIDEHRPLNADARISVNNTAGSINVQAWDKNELHLTGSLGSGVDKLELSGDASNLSIEVKLPHKSHSVDDTTLTLQVPAGVKLSLQGVSADIRVQGVRGSVEVNSVSGDINLDVKSAQVSAQTVSGDVHVQAPATSTKVNSVSGDVVVRGVSGALQGEAVSGSLDVDGGPMSDVHVNSISGDVDLSVSLADRAKVAAETLSGDVKLRLPSAPSAQLTLKSFSGDVRSDYNAVPAQAKRYEAAMGAGGGSISLSSFSGDVSITRR
ncbi:MAG TPA: DUF4097 family beta strand repeat-containing protein [Nevskiaceae bacterium]|nr:DUF4097 family beta strand repeat-containing protein [Nevskiaceae bacterium]